MYCNRHYTDQSLPNLNSNSQRPMKKPRIMRLRLLAALYSSKRRRGVAIITVLAIVSLMTILIISFFQMAQTAKTTAVNSVEMERASTLKDVITNYVTAQIRTATTLTDGGTAQSSQTIWSSQPGAIRTYHGSNNFYNRLYKLYSDDEMMIDNIKPDDSGALLNKIENDTEPQWDKYPDIYADLNRPVRPSSAEREADSPTKIRERLIYPIVDPNRYNGQESDKTRNTEGFVYGEANLSSRQPNGVDASKGQLAMPVRWIYLLKDGTAGTVDKEGKFTAMEKDGGEATTLNPMVSRIAWWADDETCKINVNTASIPIPWDNPRTGSAECLWYAQHQPVSGECQHYPGHPSQTDLCAVFFPGYRYSPDAQVMPLGLMNPLPDNYAKLVWNITPFITEEGGSRGGKDVVRPLSATPVPLDNDDHLFATFEELYFKARRAEKNLDRPRESVGRDDVSGDLLSRLEGSQFFLTTRSSGPEMTVFGTPRVCMFPMNEAVVAEVGKPSGAVNPRVGAFEVTMATNSTIGATAGVAGKPYYFQRSTNAESRHNAFYNNSAGRNAQIFKYLKKLTIAIPPGYPELSPEFNTLGKKYPGPNRLEGNRPLPSKERCNFDSSDRTQIVLQMLDLLRSSNMAPGYLASGSSYDAGGGQVAGICGCNQIKPTDVQAGHTAALVINPAIPTTYTPKGSGRTYGPAEIIFVAHVIAIKREGTGTQGASLRPINPGMSRRWNEAKVASLIQLGVLINSFSPRQGWAPLFAHSGINISNETGNGVSDPRTRTDGTLEAPFFCANNTPSDPAARPEEPFYFGNTVNGTSPTPNAGADPPIPVPPGFIPWAGVSGARVSASQTAAAFDPFVFEGVGAGTTGQIRLQLKWNPGKILRVFMYDGESANYNTIQAIEIDAGTEDIDFVNVEYTGLTLDALMQQNIAQPAASFPPAKLAATSFVVPHGDYRLTTTPLQVERGIFVPHGSKRHSIVEPTLLGSVASYVKGRAGELSPPEEQLLTDSRMTNKMNEAYAPHFAPVKKEALCREDLGSKPVDGVFTVASSRAGGTEANMFKFRFAHGRRDGQYGGPAYKRFAAANTIPNRGSSDPLETGDFDNGIGFCPDGAYMNQPDDGDARDANQPYYMGLGKKAKVNPATFSPNRVLRSAVDFGSIPSGIQARVPWQTIRFRPDPGMHDPQNRILGLGDQPRIPQGTNHFYPFSNYCGPKDHLMLDMWWMPVVEPWSLSEGFATKGLINLNQQIFPFTYIQRTTALHALLRSERMMAIPDSEAANYKNGANFPNPTVYRRWINAKETIRQLTEYRWKGKDAEEFTLPFNSFRSASEICELWLVPEPGGNSGGAPTLNSTIRQFWNEHRLTGDNMRERPYANIYPRLTTRSNVYRVHMIAQTLKKATSNKPETFTSVSTEGSDPDLVTSEWRGSALVERVLNPNEPALRTSDYAPIDGEDVFDGMQVIWPPKLDNYYTYRVTEVKQFTQ